MMVSKLAVHHHDDYHDALLASSLWNEKGGRDNHALKGTRVRVVISSSSSSMPNIIMRGATALSTRLSCKRRSITHHHNSHSHQHLHQRTSILDILRWIIRLPTYILNFLKKEEKLIDEIQDDIITEAEIVKAEVKIIENVSKDKELGEKIDAFVDTVEHKTITIHDEVEKVTETMEGSLEKVTKVTKKTRIVLDEVDEITKTMEGSTEKVSKTRRKIDVHVGETNVEPPIESKFTKAKAIQSKTSTTPTYFQESNMTLTSSIIMFDHWQKVLQGLVATLWRLPIAIQIEESFLLAFRAFLMALIFVMLLIKIPHQLIWLFI